ncbi:MAG: hypothetical protein O3A73_04520, partial [Proteobacteria bacterium]|nr:hypothetical protein [Pseudomonadota bacterium]
SRFDNIEICQQQDQARCDKKVVKVFSHETNAIGSPNNLSTYSQTIYISCRKIRRTTHYPRGKGTGQTDLRAPAGLRLRGGLPISRLM